jgi:hypothetical protein
VHYLFKSFLLLSILLACKSEKSDSPKTESKKEAHDIVFDQTKWGMKEGDTYLYRAQMLKDVVYNDTIRNLNQSELTALLGEPDRINENHLYYNISRKGLGAFTLNAKIMVVKINGDHSIAWIKIHE